MAEAHGFRVAVHVHHEMIHPVALQFGIVDYHVGSLPNDEIHAVMVIPAADEANAKQFAERIFKVAETLPRLFVGIAIEKYAVSDGETLDRTWFA